jgi:hypothetical protein
MTELQYIPEHRQTAASAVRELNTQEQVPANPISNLLNNNKMGGCKGENRQSKGPLRNPVLDVVLGAVGPGWRTVAASGWTDADKLERHLPPRIPDRCSGSAFRLPIWVVRLPNGQGSVCGRNWKRPSPCACCVCDSYCINLLTVAMPAC